MADGACGAAAHARKEGILQVPLPFPPVSARVREHGARAEDGGSEHAAQKLQQGKGSASRGGGLHDYANVKEEEKEEQKEEEEEEEEEQEVVMDEEEMLKMLDQVSSTAVPQLCP